MLNPKYRLTFAIPILTTTLLLQPYKYEFNFKYTI